MKNVIGFLAILCLPLLATAQSTDSTIDGLDAHLPITGYFGGLTSTFQLDDERELSGFFGVELADNFDVIANFNRLEYPSKAFGTSLTLRNRGIGLSYRPLESMVIHPIVTTTFNRSSVKIDSKDLGPTNKFYTIQPQAGLEINATRFLKIDLTAGYNVYLDLNDELASDNMPDFFGQISFKFGGFFN